MDLRLSDLKIFIAVAETGSTTRAAQNLAMTQPGVSQHISSLEEELGRKLFDRTGNRIELNDFGRIFLKEARDLLERAQKLETLGKGLSCETGSIRLGLTDSSTQTVIPKAFAAFKKRHPNVHIRLDVDDSANIEYGVMRGHYDLGVVTASARPHSHIIEEPLYTDRIEALVSKSHPLAKRKRIALEDLAQWPLLVYPRQSRTRRIIDDAFNAKKIIPKETIDVYINTAAVRLAEVGLGVALLSKAFITSEMLKHKCAHIRITGDPLSRTISAVRRRDAHLSDSAYCFYELLMGRKPH